MKIHPCSGLKSQSMLLKNVLWSGGNVDRVSKNKGFWLKLLALRKCYTKLAF
jgi:hypothetical protein